VIRLVLLGVDAVVDHPDPALVHARIRREHVPLHAPGHGDDGVGVLDRGPLAERRERVAAAELLGLPRPQRLQAVRGDHMRHPVQQLRGVAGEVGVPGVAVHDVGAVAPGGHLQIDAHRAQRGVGAGQSGRFRVRRHARLVALSAEAVHADVGEGPQVTGKILDVHAGAAVHLRGVFAGKEIDADGCGAGVGHGRRIVASAGARARGKLASLPWLSRCSQSF
jgi:hypothetical protein